MKRLSLIVGLLLSFVCVQPAFGQTQGCQFVLGFKTLHDLDPGDAGDCVDNQTFATNGDAQQHTTKGLMAWRKADNWTAFTNGYQTWINGPAGLAKRLNTDRFAWEHDGSGAPAPAAPSSDYIPQILAMSQKLGTAVAKIGDLMKNPQITDAGWEGQFNSQLDVFHAAYQQARQMTPPPALTGVHQDVVACLQHYDQAATDLSGGLQQFNLTAIFQALNEVNAGTSLLSKISNELLGAKPSS
jgi:hypothetical protein